MEKTWTEVEWDWEEWQPPQLPFDWWEFVMNSNQLQYRERLYIVRQGQLVSITREEIYRLLDNSYPWQRIEMERQRRDVDGEYIWRVIVQQQDLFMETPLQNVMKVDDKEL